MAKKKTKKATSICPACKKREKIPFRCPTCGDELCWGGDFDFEDYGITGDGVVSNYSCLRNDCHIYLEIYQGEME